MEIQKTLNSQSNLEKEGWNWRYQPAWLQALLQSHSYQDSMVLAQRQKYRSIEQNRKPRDGGSDGKACVYNVGDPGSIPGLGRSSGEGNGNPLQYYCLENPMDRGSW